MPFDGSSDSGNQCARRVGEILAATTHIGYIRERATEICIGLQDLELPALVTLAIVDEAVHENDIRMWAKWELIVFFWPSNTTEIAGRRKASKKLEVIKVRRSRKSGPPIDRFSTSISL